MDSTPLNEDGRHARGGLGSALLALVVLIAAAPAADVFGGSRDPLPHRQSARAWPGVLAKAVLRFVGVPASPEARGLPWRPLAGAEPRGRCILPGLPRGSAAGLAHVRAALLALPPPARRV